MTHAAATRSRAMARLVWVVAAVGVGMSSLLLLTTAASAADATSAQIASAITSAFSLVAFVVSGALIVSRQPHNVVGWLLLIPGIAVPFSQLATNWLTGLTPPPESVTPALWLLLWTTSWSWILLIFPILHLLLTFPDGRLLSPRWRWAVALEVAMITTMLAISALDGSMGVVVGDLAVWTVPNPIGVLPANFFDATVGPIWGFALLVITVTSVTAVVVRFRRGSRLERQQLKWPLLAVVLFGVTYGVTAINSEFISEAIGGIVFSVALAGIPISVAIAVLRYRLYAIDRIISRTISWGAITGLLVAVFAGCVIGLQAILAGIFPAETFAVAASTLVAVGLFQPIRRRVQRAVDRRFDRARFDTERTASEFANRLRGKVAIEAISAELETTIDRSIKPTRQGLWLRVVRGQFQSPGS